MSDTQQRIDNLVKSSGLTSEVAPSHSALMMGKVMSGLPSWA